MTGRRDLRRKLFSDLPVKVICIAAAVVLFMFHRVSTLTERFFSVPLAVDVPAGLAVASAYPHSVRITLRGVEEAIYPIVEDDVEANANLESHKTPGVYRASVKITRKGTAAGVEPLEVKVDPQYITFTLEPLVERKVGVKADVRGSPAYGYDLIQSSLSPQSVVIRGPKGAVQAAGPLLTEAIDLTGRTSSFTQHVKVIVPSSFVKVAGEAAVDFKAVIQETVLSKRLDGVAIVAFDLSPHLALKAVLPPGSLQLKGAQLTLEASRPDQLRLIIDCSGIRRPGVYVLHPRPEVPQGVEILDYAPRAISVELVPSGGSG